MYSAVMKFYKSSIYKILYENMENDQNKSPYYNWLYITDSEPALRSKAKNIKFMTFQI